MYNTFTYIYTSYHYNIPLPREYICVNAVVGTLAVRFSHYRRRSLTAFSFFFTTRYITSPISHNSTYTILCCGLVFVAVSLLLVVVVVLWRLRRRKTSSSRRSMPHWQRLNVDTDFTIPCTGTDEINCTVNRYLSITPCS